MKNIYKTLCVFVLAVFCFNQMILVATSEDRFPKEWPYLFHVESDFIANDDFYLTNDRLVENEYYNFVELVKTKKLGPQIVCRFPARYLVAKMNIQNLPQYDVFLDCPLFNEYYLSFKKKYVGLVLSSEYFNAPSSLFGHVMLVFHNEEVPELDSDTINFAAQTDKNDGGIIKYLASGIGGGFWGEYFREKLFEKVHEYNRVEQRFMYFYDLDLNQLQKQILIAHLYEMQGAKFKYYFFKKNCSFQIDRLLKVVLSNQEVYGRIYNLPIETIYANKTSIKKMSFLTPDVLLIKKMYKKLTPSEKNEVSLLVKSQDLDIKEKSSYSDRFKKFIHLFYRYSFRSKRKVLPNYKLVEDLKYFDNDDLDIQSLNPLDRSYPSKFRYSLNYNKKNKISHDLHFRPVLTDVYDYQEQSMHESEFSLLSPTISFENDKIKMKEFSIVNLMLLSKYDSLDKNFSWSGHIGFNRKNNRNKLFQDTNIGFGQTYSVDNLLEFSLLAKIGFQNDLNNFFPFYGASSVVSSYFLNKFKLTILPEIRVYKDGVYYKQEQSITYYSLPKSSFSFAHNYDRQQKNTYSIIFNLYWY